MSSRIELSAVERMTIERARSTASAGDALSARDVDALLAVLARALDAADDGSDAPLAPPS